MVTIGMSFLGAFLLAMFLTMIIIPPMIRLAPRLHLVDRPNERKVHVLSIPRVGGIGMFFGAILPLLFNAELSPLMVGYLISSSIIFVFGVLDDRIDLDFRLKFLSQFAAAFVIVFVSGIRISYLPFAGLEPVADWIAIPITVIFIVGITNAINLADGLDGLAGGMTLLAMVFLVMLGVGEERDFVALAALAMIGSVLGFLRFNTHPARVFMGDCGSQFLGFSAAVLSLSLTQAEGNLYSPLLPLLIFALPIIDTATVMFIRIREGRSPFSPDKNHLHHRLLALGMRQFEAVSSIYFLQTTMIISAWFLRYATDGAIALVFLGFAVVLNVSLMMSVKIRRAKAQMVAEPGEVHTVDWSRYRTLGNVCVIAVVSVLLVYLGALLFKGQAIDSDTRMILLLLLLGGVFLPPWLNEELRLWVSRALLYGCIALAVYASRDYFVDHNAFQDVHFAVCFGLLLLVLAAYKIRTLSNFEVNPLDLLVLIAALILPSTFSEFFAESWIKQGVAVVAVLFYIVEAIISSRNWTYKILHYGAVGILMAVIIKPMLI